MKSKILLLAALCAIAAAPISAQNTAGPKDLANQEVLDWIKDKTLEAAERRSSEIAQGYEAKRGQLIIIPLAEWDAPSSVKESVERGITNRSNGAFTVEPGTIPSTEAIIGRLANTRRTDAELKQRLGYVPADLSRTPIGAAELLSTEPSGSINGATSTGVLRAYRVPNVGVIILDEINYVASGREITLIRETFNEYVNGVPARAAAYRSEDGRGQAQLNWVTPLRAYELKLYTDDGDRIEQGQALLLQIAKGLKS